MDKQSLHEINRYADAAFPVGMYTVTKSEIIPERRGYMDILSSTLRERQT